MATRKRLLLAITSAALSFACGCQTPAKIEPAAKQTQDVTALAKKFQVDFFTAIQNKDVKLIRPFLIPELQEKFTSEKFSEFAEAIIKNGGKMEKAEYMGSLDKGGLFKIFVWKFAYEKGHKKMPDGTVSTVENMFILIVSQVDGKQQIFSWSFQ